jgi:hypothetical protein
MGLHDFMWRGEVLKLYRMAMVTTRIAEQPVRPELVVQVGAVPAGNRRARPEKRRAYMVVVIVVIVGRWWW